MFGYDPQGRRICKQAYRDDDTQPLRRTLFHWQRLRLLQVVQDGGPSLHVYADLGGDEPLAHLGGKSDSKDILCFHTNLAGLPKQRTGAEFNRVWHSEEGGCDPQQSESRIYVIKSSTFPGKPAALQHAQASARPAKSTT